MSKAMTQMERSNAPLLIKAKGLRHRCDSLALKGQHKSDEWNEAFLEYVSTINKLQYPTIHCIAP